MEEDVEEVDTGDRRGGGTPHWRFRCLNRRRHHRQLCWQWLAFGWVVQDGQVARAGRQLKGSG